MLRAYYRLAKPGIIYSNVLTAIAGYLFGSKWSIQPVLFIASTVGTALVIASGCVINNVIDRRIDAKMERTRKRVSVTGAISPVAGLVFASVVGLLGFGLLLVWSRPAVAVIGFIAIIDYVVLYGMAKRHTPHSTLIGSISGSASLVGGYVAARGHFDTAAALIGLALVCWQMTHFYGIALYRQRDYTAAGLPVLPVARGLRRTKWEAVGYLIIFLVLCLALPLLGYAGMTFLCIMLATNLIWLYRTMVVRRAADSIKWGRGVFFDSLFVNIIFCLGLSLATVLP